jgi:hypothetical protein
MFESEKKDVDILKEITKGIKLRHVRTNDRSKPNLKGTIAGVATISIKTLYIMTFKQQYSEL